MKAKEIINKKVMAMPTNPHLSPKEKAIRMLELKAQWAEESEKAKNKTPDLK